MEFKPKSTPQESESTFKEPVAQNVDTIDNKVKKEQDGSSSDLIKTTTGTIPGLAIAADASDRNATGGTPSWNPSSDVPSVSVTDSQTDGAQNDEAKVQVEPEQSKVEEEKEAEHVKKLSPEEEAKNTIYHSLGGHISKKFERIGYNLEDKNEQERYDYFGGKIAKLEDKIEFKISDEDWKIKVERGCVNLFYGEPKSAETTAQLLKDYVKNN